MKSRVGIIGAGIHGIKILKALSYAQKNGEAELVALADIDENVVNRQSKEFNIKGYTDYKIMLEKEKLDAVAVATPDFLHREITLDVLSHGINVLVEKPLDTTSQGAIQMVKAAKENNAILFTDYHKRFDPAHIQMKEYILNGKLGEVQYGYAHMEDKIIVPTEWLKKWAEHSSPAWFLGIHFYDLIYWLIDSKPRKIFAAGIKGKLASIGIDTYDSIHAEFTFENGSLFSVDTSWILPKSFPSIVNQGIRIIGSKGIIEVDSQSRGVEAAVESENSSSVLNPFAVLDVDMPGHMNVLHGYVFDSIINFVRLVNMKTNGIEIDKCSYPSGESALVSTKMCEAVHESIRTGQFVNINKEDMRYD